MKRGQSGTDLIIAVVVIFVVALIGILGSFLWGSIDSGFQSQLTGSANAQALAASTNTNTNMASGWNIALIVGLCVTYIGLFITTRYIETNPMFFFINVFVLLFCFIFAAILSNVFDTATNRTEFVVQRAAQPAAVFVMNNLLAFAIIAGVIILIGLFAKPSQGAV